MSALAQRARELKSGMTKRELAALSEEQLVRLVAALERIAADQEVVRSITATVRQVPA